MDINTGIFHALNGNAVLFVGSGFSRNATNCAGESLKTGKELSNRFLELLKISEEMPLKTAASIFCEKMGVNELFRIFKREFKVKNITDEQKIITSLPWMRIYTTNYDDVVESAFIRNGKNVIPVTLKNHIDKNGALPLCIHINGYVDSVTRETFNEDVRLTEESYDIDTIRSSAWIELLRSDIKLARAIFFVGYGLDDSDIELRWLLNESESNKEKTFFITGSNPSYLEQRKVASFGHLYPIQSTGFAQNIITAKSKYTIPVYSFHIGSSFVEYQMPKYVRDTTSDDAFNLFCYGKLCNELIKNDNYLLPRRRARDMMAAVRTDTDILAIYSDIAGGKKICLQEFASMAVLDKFRVFYLKCINCDTPKEFASIQEISLSQKCIVIIENFTYFYDDIVSLLRTKERNIVIVFSSRTPSHEIFISRIMSDFSGSNIVSIDISILNGDEISWLIKTFKTFGLLGGFASKSASEISAIFSGNKCRSKMGSILLTIFEQPEVASRIAREYDSIKKDPISRKILISSYILSLLGCPRIYETLVRIWGISKLNDSSIKNSSLRNFINFESGEITAISSSFSKYILRIEARPFIFDLLLEIFELVNPIRDLRKIRKDLMTYGKLSKLFFNDDSNDFLPRYYNELRVMCEDNVLFWLQYAICMDANGQYSQADVYFSTAYALAKKGKNFNPYQVDNSYEKHLLLKSLTLPFESAFEHFSLAHEKLMADLK